MTPPVQIHMSVLAMRLYKLPVITGRGKSWALGLVSQVGLSQLVVDQWLLPDGDRD